MKNRIQIILVLFFLIILNSLKISAQINPNRFSRETVLPKQLNSNIKVLATPKDDDGYLHENPNIPHPLGTTSGSCVPGTINRFTGSYHSNLYIGNSGGANVLLEWGQNMSLYITGAGTNDTTPKLVPAANYAGVPLEVRSSSSGGAAGLSALLLRTSTNLYFFGTAVNLTAITTMPSFGGASLTAANSNVTAKLPSGITIDSIAQMAISQNALGLVTKGGSVFMLTTLQALQGDSTVPVNTTIWHQVKISGGASNLTGITKLSLSSSGAFTLKSDGNIYYWGAPANVAGVANVATSYNRAYNMTAQIPAGKTVNDLVCLGTKVPSSSTLFILCSDQKVYASGLNTNGCLGINNATVATNAGPFGTVKDSTGTVDLDSIVKIDGDTEADIFCMAALTSDGRIFGWGDSPAGMLGVNAATGSFAVPKTKQLFLSPAPLTGFSDFSVAGHFIIAFYSNVGTSTDQYWYLGHNTGGSIGDPANSTAYILSATPAHLNASGGISFSCSNAVPTINSTGTISAFTGCTGSPSSPQTIHLSGDNLTSAISISAPSGYEVSKNGGSNYSSSISLVPYAGTVNDTAILVRLTGSASNGALGNISCTATSATTVTFTIPAATISPVSQGGSIAGGTTVNSNINSTLLTLSGQIGSITKWQSSPMIDFSSGVIDIANSSTTYTAINLTETTYFRAEVTSGVCSSAYSSTSTMIYSPLPLKWIQIQAFRQSKLVKINWTTSSEMNVKCFDVERSLNGSDWLVIIANIAANNGINNNYYQQTDTAYNANRLFYRVRQKDIDGRFTYSYVQTVANIADINMVTIFPVPAENNFHLGNVNPSAVKQVQLFNASGALIKTWNKLEASFDLQGIPAGVYMIQINLNNQEKQILKLYKK